MQNPLAKTPFLLLLIPLIIGILLQYYLEIINWSIAFFFAGIIVMLCSYFLPVNKNYPLRWLFGSGLFFLLIGVGMVSTSFCQDKSEFAFDNENNLYRGIVIDIPQEKPRSVAYRVYLPDIDKQMVCYFQPDSMRSELKPGDEFIFDAVIQPFRNSGNPDDFDYVRYMYNKGYVGSAYVSAHSWMATRNLSASVKIQAQRLRQKIIGFYKSLGFDETEYSILSALTLGYQDALSDDVKQSFRATGTAHVLAVSGLHVGIIYAIISFLLGFIKRNSRIFWLKPLLIILILWVYAFITGLPPSVIRASTMLTVFCLSEIFHRKGFTPNALYIAAFFMLLINPFSLFDVGFQLSFVSVMAILYLHPKAVALIDVRNKQLNYIWQMFTLSMVAQLGTFPLCLYYFGTFPVYFFLANMLIVPLVMFITYTAATIVIAKILTYAFPAYGYYIYYLPVNALKLLVKLLTEITEFFESLPYALVSNINISFLELILIIVCIISLFTFFIKMKAHALIVSLCTVLIMISMGLYNNLSSKPDELIVYNRRDITEVEWTIDGQQCLFKKDSLQPYEIFEMKDRKLLILSNNDWSEKYSEQKLKVDWLLLTEDNSFSLNSLTEIFSFDTVIVNGSLSNRTIRQIVNDSQKLGIGCHDVTQNGAYRSNF